MPNGKNYGSFMVVFLGGRSVSDINKLGMHCYIPISLILTKKIIQNVVTKSTTVTREYFAESEITARRPFNK